MRLPVTSGNSTTENQVIKYIFCRDALDELESDMEEMENNNISNAVIVMRNATGLLQIHDENTTTEDMCYSSNQNTINVRPEKDYSMSKLGFFINQCIFSFHRMLTVKVSQIQTFHGL